MEYALKSSWKCLLARLETGEESLPPAVAACCANLDQGRGWWMAGGQEQAAITLFSTVKN